MNQFRNETQSEMFFQIQRMAWRVIVEVFTVCILLDQALFGEYDNHVITNNFNGSSYDFIIGENLQIYCCLIFCTISQGHRYTKFRKDVFQEFMFEVEIALLLDTIILQFRSFLSY